MWRRRKAVALLIFGIVSGFTCTDAILGAVREEAAVVQLAQQLAAHEAVVADTTRWVLSQLVLLLSVHPTSL